MSRLDPSPPGESTTARAAAQAHHDQQQQHTQHSAHQRHSRTQEDEAGPSGRPKPGAAPARRSSSQRQHHPGVQQDEPQWLSDSSQDEDDRPAAHQQAAADPLYDDQADEKDMAWALAARQGRASDAFLSCPGCFATLCIDCQQHHLYSTQFRAMFVMNCEARTQQPLNVPSPGAGKRGSSGGRKRRLGEAAPEQEQEQQQQQQPGDVCYPVHCATCGTRVGVVDADEVYHFTSVLVSTA